MTTTHHKLFHFRFWCLFGLVACLGLLGYALYAQHQMFLDPCPLCIFQRIAFLIMAVGFALGLALGGRGWLRVVSVLVIAMGGAAGLGVSGWHVYLQQLPPDQVPGCGPGLEYMLQTLPLSQVLSKVFAGSGECAEVDWTFLGLSMPAWTFIWYALLLVGTVWALRQKRMN
ncbi:disulfide bond formation protein B [Pseudomarimonas arenosa]|uniref:Disulfide bond formation protein B n=1 Tax=Pseudomarimonas arenosa TaxID=2774145 RepID=A0AAW3ZQ22_9GAMM|nr:disulfide bond formation protein B [Pseudomarimonas arenosa]MBD8527584.1 disulfide bond formation protein B [Pseudomarimonas arenosa]